jgi:peptidyl-prolyl cis-trans isomerase B (cyclophilin B)
MPFFQLPSRWLLLGAVLGLSLPGCGNNEAKKADVTPPEAQVEGKEKSAGKQIAATPASLEKSRLHLPFREGVLLESPTDEQRPPDLTCTGKNTGKIYEAIAGKDGKGGLWDQVLFVNADGKKVKYTALVTTKDGDIHLELYPQAAPNHVRSFVSLAKAGYFDGMPFYRSHREINENGTVAFIESGCPKGTGEFGYGSIGYWLRPEISNTLTHDEGVLGAWHREELETASCRFYLAAEKMPQMDGSFTIFGKVTRGLDVVRTINKRPVQNMNDWLLVEPVTIQQVIIQTSIAD